MEPPSPHQARLIIDLDALAANYRLLCEQAAGPEVAPVVKADGYGLGVGPAGRRLWSEGARRFFVARLHEGEALRTALGPDRPARIYVLDGLAAGAAPRLRAAGLTPVLSSLPQISAARASAAGGEPWRVGLHVDTGMNRQGLTPTEARALAETPDALRGLDLDLLMSHLGSSAQPDDPRNGEQLARFQAVRALFPGAPASLAASGGVFLDPRYRFDVVRPGISLFGGGPEERPDDRIRAVATLTAPIVDVRSLAPGERAGYGASVTAERPMRLAIVAAGYADGVLRAGRKGGYAWYAGARRPLVFVTMDLLAIDVGDAAVTIGDHVELVGPNAKPDDLALAAGTVSYEVLVRLSPRAERIYLGET